MGEVKKTGGPFLTPLQKITHPKGDVYHAMKASDNGFFGFGEAYFTHINKGEIKGWKKHLHMQMNLIVPVGEVCFYIYSEDTEVTSKFILGNANYQRLTVPPELWVAFEGLSSELNLILNVSSIEHDRQEAVNKEIEFFPLDRR